GKPVENRLSGRVHLGSDVGAGNGIDAIHEHPPVFENTGIFRVERGKPLEGEGSRRTKLDPAKANFGAALVCKVSLDNLEPLAVRNRTMKDDADDLEPRRGDDPAGIGRDAGKEE